MAKISVIVPVYNAEQHLQACLDSLLQQTFSDIEIICIDDGSTDKSYEILLEYARKDCRVKLVQQSNSGVAIARNKGLEYATGEWLAFCDSDDTVPPRAYEYLYNASKNVDIVIGDYCKINDFGEKTLVSKKGKHATDLLYAMFKFSSLWTKLFRRSFIVENNISFQDIAIGEDMVFLSEVVVKEPRYKIISKVVYHYWEHNNTTEKSLTHKYNYELFSSHVYCRKEFLRICWEEHNIYEAYDLAQRTMISSLVQHLLRMYDLNDKEMSFNLFKEYVRLFDWTEHQELFKSTVGMAYQEFMVSSAEHYFSTNSLFNSAEAVLRRYEAGQMGFRYILKYIKAWVEYKIKRF